MKNLILLYCLGLILVFTSCDVQDSITPRDYPFVETIGISSIDPTGAILDFRFQEFGKNEISSYGVDFIQLEETGNPNYQRESFTTELNGKPDEENVSVKISHDLIPGIKYTAFPFVRSGQTKILGSPSTFISKGISAPEIISVSKTKLGLNWNFKIIGKNFSSKKEYNEVKVLGAEPFFSFSVNYASSDTLIISLNSVSYRVGNIEDKFDLMVKSRDQSVILSNHFSIDYPRILSISTLKIAPGEEAVITTNLDNESEFLYFTINVNRNHENYLYIPLEKLGVNQYKFTMPDFPVGTYPIGLYSSHYRDEQSTVGVHYFYDQNLEIISK